MIGDEDFARLQRLFDAQEVLSRLTPEQLPIVEKEGTWVREQIESGRRPSPEKLLENAPLLMRLVADMDSGDDL